MWLQEVALNVAQWDIQMDVALPFFCLFFPVFFG